MMMNLSLATTAATNSNFKSTIDPYAIVGASEAALVIESTFLLLVSTVAFTANASLWLVVLTTRDLRTESNVLILCLSLADLLVAVVGAPITISSIISSRWLFGRDVCTFVGFMNMLTFVASVQSLGVISLNRYFKICRPAKYLDIYTFRNVGFMFVGVWIYSGLLSTPPLIGWASYDFLPMASICFCDWEESPTYAIFMILMCFCVPCFAMILCYVAIIKAFLRSRRVVMAFSSSVKVVPPSSKASANANPNNNVIDEEINTTQGAANGSAQGTAPRPHVRCARSQVSTSNLFRITENPVDATRPIKHVGNPPVKTKHYTTYPMATDPRNQASGAHFDKTKSNNLLKVEDFRGRESRPISGGFTLRFSDNNEEMKLKENPDLSKSLSYSSLSLQQGLFPDTVTNEDFKLDCKSSKNTNHDNNMFDGSSVQSEKNATVSMIVTTEAEFDHNTTLKINENPSEFQCVIEYDSQEHATLLEKKSKDPPPISRSHSYTDSREHSSTEYGTIGAAGFWYKRSLSELPGTSQSSKSANQLALRSSSPVSFTIGQRNDFPQAMDREYPDLALHSEPSRAGKSLQRPLVPKPLMLPSVDSLNPFQSYTPSSASTSLLSSDFSSSSNPQIPLNLFQYSSQHAQTVRDKPLSPTFNTLRLSKSEEMISRLSTTVLPDSDSNTNNTKLGAQQHPLARSSKTLSSSSPTLMPTSISRAKMKPQGTIHSQKRTREEFQLAGSLLVVIFIFIICWFPYCISMFVSITSTSTHALDITSLLLGYMNSCVNPIVYGVMNRRFKMGYRKLFVRLLRITPCSKQTKIGPVSHMSKSNSSIT